MAKSLELVNITELENEIKRIYKDHYEQCYDKCMHDAFNAVFKRMRGAKRINATEVVYCKHCVLHGNCTTEEAFNIARIENPYCCAGKKKSKK